MSLQPISNRRQMSRRRFFYRPPIYIFLVKIGLDDTRLSLILTHSTFTMPITLPGVLVSFILSWSDFVFSLILITTDELQTLPYGLASTDDAYDANWGELMADSTMICLPSLLLFAFLRDSKIITCPSSCEEGEYLPTISPSPADAESAFQACSWPLS